MNALPLQYDFNSATGGSGGGPRLIVVSLTGSRGFRFEILYCYILPLSSKSLLSFLSLSLSLFCVLLLLRILRTRLVLWFAGQRWGCALKNSTINPRFGEYYTMRLCDTVLLSIFVSSAVASLNSPPLSMSTCAAPDGAACAPSTPASIFDFSADSIRGESIQLSSFRGKKAFLVVNVACQ